MNAIMLWNKMFPCLTTKYTTYCTSLIQMEKYILYSNE